MRPDPVVLIIENVEYLIRPLTLRQVREVDKILRDTSLGEVDKILEIVRIALSRDHAERAASLYDAEVSLVDLGPMCELVLKVGGMVVTTGGNEAQIRIPGT